MSIILTVAKLLATPIVELNTVLLQRMLLLSRCSLVILVTTFFLALDYDHNCLYTNWFALKKIDISRYRLLAVLLTPFHPFGFVSSTGRG